MLLDGTAISTAANPLPERPSGGLDNARQGSLVRLDVYYCIVRVGAGSLLISKYDMSL